MKSSKILKRMAKIESLMSKVTERSSASAPHIRELLRDAKAAITRATKAVSLEVSSGTVKNLPVNGPKHTSKATPEPAKPKRKLSTVGRRAISEATKKRWAAKRAAAAKAAPAVAKKLAVKKSTPVKAAKPAARKVAKKVPAKKRTAVRVPAKHAVKVVQAAKKPAHPKAAATTVTTPEQAVPEVPVQ